MTLPELIREKWNALSKGIKSATIVLFIIFVGSLLFLMGVEIGDTIYRAFN